jgi:hypothetical protein
MGSHDLHVMSCGLLFLESWKAASDWPDAAETIVRESLGKRNHDCASWSCCNHRLGKFLALESGEGFVLRLAFTSCKQKQD